MKAKATLGEFRAVMNYVNTSGNPVDMEKYQSLMSTLSEEMPDWYSCLNDTILSPKSEKMYKEFRDTLPPYIDNIPPDVDEIVSGIRSTNTGIQ